MQHDLSAIAELLVFKFLCAIKNFKVTRSSPLIISDFAVADTGTMGARRIFSRGGRIHRRSQDFLCGVHFFNKKVDGLF